LRGLRGRSRALQGDGRANRPNVDVALVSPNRI
jgi:hypothetical protein